MAIKSPIILFSFTEVLSFDLFMVPETGRNGDFDIFVSKADHVFSRIVREHSVTQNLMNTQSIN